MELLFEDLRPPGAERVEAGAAAASSARERAGSLIQDGITVARAADAALFDPLAVSDEKSHAAYEAALRVRKGLPTLQPTPRKPGGE
jgi:hypothetical protein